MLMLLAEKWTPDSAGIAYLRGSKLRSTCGDGRLARPVEQSETPDPYGQPPPIGAAIANVGATDASHEQRGEVRSRGFSADRRSLSSSFRCAEQCDLSPLDHCSAKQETMR